MNEPIHIDEKGSGPPVVWIHGFPLSSLIFEQQLSIPDVRHLTLDLPGFGRTSASEVSSIDDYADVVLSILDDKGISRAVLAGVSMGGYVTFAIVRKRPNLAPALLLIDTRETPDSPEARANRYAQSDRVAREGTDWLVDEMMPKMLTSATVSTGDRRVELVRQSMTSASNKGVRSALRAMAERPDSSDTLAAFDRRVLVFVGTRDEITTPADAERMAAHSSHSSVIRIADAAHLSCVERPDEFNAALTAHLGELG